MAVLPIAYNYRLRRCAEFQQWGAALGTGPPTMRATVNSTGLSVAGQGGDVALTEGYLGMFVPGPRAFSLLFLLVCIDN
jgi:hypothetical protein